ncbi:MAG TPA: glycosyltransferase [Usitatibacter sp.]|nr:glycosyltransferase [Usitatibacter sp.]
MNGSVARYPDRWGSQPLVSVIIRTIGRASLRESIQSVLRQTYRPIELIIVNALPNHLPALPSAAALETQVVGGRKLTRPEAANMGLEAARGEWIIFLDDDDTFLPEHIASLVERLSASDGALVAYSATTLVDRKDASLGEIHLEFSRWVLFSLNYIQTGAALFSRQFVTEGLRFDESFECLQDWDFWIQLAQRTHFAFTRKATDHWSVFTGESGTEAELNRDPVRVKRYAELLTQKWAPLARRLSRQLRHHESMAERARKQGREALVEAHLKKIERIDSGPASRVGAGRSTSSLAFDLPSLAGIASLSARY